MKLLLTLCLATAAFANTCVPAVITVCWIGADTDRVGNCFTPPDNGLWCNNFDDELAWWLIVDDCDKEIKSVTITTKRDGVRLRTQKEEQLEYFSFGDYEGNVPGGAFSGRNVRGIDLTPRRLTSYEVKAVITTTDNKTSETKFALDLLDSCSGRRLGDGVEDATPIYPET